MRSKTIKEGLERVPHRALLYATGISKSEMKKPFIGIASSHTDLIPGHIGMRDLERFIEKGVHAADILSFLVSPASATALPWGIRACIILCHRES
jgi:dihydroxy-acid dehydratase